MDMDGDFFDSLCYDGILDGDGPEYYYEEENEVGLPFIAILSISKIEKETPKAYKLVGEMKLSRNILDYRSGTFFKVYDFNGWIPRKAIVWNSSYVAEIIGQKPRDVEIKSGKNIQIEHWFINLLASQKNIEPPKISEW